MTDDERQDSPEEEAAAENTEAPAAPAEADATVEPEVDVQGQEPAAEQEDAAPAEEPVPAPEPEEPAAEAEAPAEEAAEAAAEPPRSPPPRPRSPPPPTRSAPRARSATPRRRTRPRPSRAPTWSPTWCWTSRPRPTRTPRRATTAEGGESSEEAAPEPISTTILELAADARYLATGKRKSAVARVTIKPGTGVYTVNGKELDEFFPRPTLQRIVRGPLETVGQQERLDVVAKIHGGGVSSQAGALRHGIARALVEADPNLRGELKRRGFLTRDPRVKERKKAGLKKARKRPQFSKR